MLPPAGKIILLVLLIAVVYFFTQRANYLISLLKLGKAENRFDQPGQRLKFALGQMLLQRCVLKNVTKNDLSGVGHMLIFYGFSLFVISYGFHIAEGFYEKLSPALFGEVFNNLFFLLLDSAGLLVIFALIWAAIRRYLIRPFRLQPITGKGPAIILTGIFLLMIVGFSVEGFRLLAEDRPFADWAFVGTAFSNLFSSLGLEQNARALFLVFWFLHIVLIFAFGIYILYSKHLHILAAPFNLYFHSLEPKGALQPVVGMEEAESFGVPQITDFSWKHLLDLYACTECGQCTANCPATLSEKALNPKEVILSLKKTLLTHGKDLLDKKGAEKKEEINDSMIKELITEDVLWDCTNCRACMEVCPVDIQHVDKIIDMRRYLVLMECNFPSEVKATFRGMERNNNPWGIGSSTRGDWAKDLDIRNLSEDGGEVDLLFFLGCAASFDDRNQKIAGSIVKILQAAGINFGILGREEGCCGDSARRIGNEYLYQTMAEQNISTFYKHKIKKILVSCPHGYNTIKNEYPQFGGEFEVVHHTEFIWKLIQEGKLTLKGELAKTVTYHDSCFLGRYNSIYDAPRQILASIPNTKIIEMDRNRRYAFCCGAGGGRMWMEKVRGRRVFAMRAEQALAKNPDYIVTACPFCMIHFQDGLKFLDAEDKAKIFDIAEIVRNQL
jgi:Fe-S oxidoreductase